MTRVCPNTLRCWCVQGRCDKGTLRRTNTHKQTTPAAFCPSDISQNIKKIRHAPSRVCGLKFRCWRVLVFPLLLWCRNASMDCGWTQCSNCAWRYGSIDFIFPNPIWSTAQIARIIYNSESVWLNYLRASQVTVRKTSCLCVKGGNARLKIVKCIDLQRYYAFSGRQVALFSKAATYMQQFPWSIFVKLAA